MTNNYEQAAEEWLAQQTPDPAPDDPRGMFKRMLRMLRKDAFLAGCEHARPKWVSVKEHLPKEAEEYLVSFAYVDIQGTIKQRAFVTMLLFNIEDKYFESKDMYGPTLWRDGVELRITHWMPLPDKPEGEL